MDMVRSGTVGLGSVSLRLVVSGSLGMGLVARCSGAGLVLEARHGRILRLG